MIYNEIEMEKLLLSQYPPGLGRALEKTHTHTYSQHKKNSTK